MEYATVRNAHRFSPAAPDEEFVFGACSPGWHSAASRDAALDDWLAFMRERGVERVCCLVPGREADGNVERYRQVFGSDAVRHAPLVDNRLADSTTLQADVLPFLEAATSARERVVLHCLDGIGRTGQALAAWLAYDRDYDPARAVETVKRMGRLPDDPGLCGHASEEKLHALLESVRRGSPVR